MRSLILSLLLLLGVVSAESQIITGTLTVTNTAGVTNGQTLTINGSLRMFSNSVPSGILWIQSGTNIYQVTTNIFNSYVANKAQSATLFALTTTNSVTWQSYPNTALTLVPSAGWATVSYSTNVLTNAIAVRIPASVEGSTQRAYIGSELVNYIGSATNSFTGTAASGLVAGLVNLSGPQTISGTKTFSVGPVLQGNTTLAGQILGTAAGYITLGTTNLSKIPYLSVSTSLGVTNANVWGGIFNAPIITNSPVIYAPTVTGGTFNTHTNVGITYGTNFSSSAGTASLDLGDDGGTRGVSLLDPAESGIFISSPNSFITFEAGQVSITNSGGNGILSADRFKLQNVQYLTTNNAGLASGNNSDVSTGNAVIVRLSGPSAAFTVHGVSGGFDGRYVILENDTGYNLTIADQSGLESTSSRRIKTGIGASITLTNNPSMVHLYYNASLSLWVVDSYSN